MAFSEYSAFDALPDDGGSQPHHIITKGTIKQEDGISVLATTIPVSALEQAKKGTSQQRGTIGFRLTIAFEREGKPFELHANWVALRRQKH
jgi:hypothetical protein